MFWNSAMELDSNPGKIKAWLFGHIHQDYHGVKHDITYLVSPRGYQMEKLKRNWKLAKLDTHDWSIDFTIM